MTNMHTLDVMSNVDVSSGAKSSAKSGVESSAKSSAKSSAIRQGKTVGKNENIIFRAIRDNSYVSIAELQRKTRLSNGGVRKIISVLKSKGRMVRVGGTNGGRWEVVKGGGTVGLGMKCLAALRQESKLGNTHWQWQADSETKETDHENKKNEQSNCDCAGARRSGFLRPGGTGVVEHGRARRQYAHSAGRPDGMPG